MKMGELVGTEAGLFKNLIEINVFPWKKLVWMIWYCLS